MDASDGRFGICHRRTSSLGVECPELGRPRGAALRMQHRILDRFAGNRRRGSGPPSSARGTEEPSSLRPPSEVNTFALDCREQRKTKTATSDAKQTMPALAIPAMAPLESEDSEASLGDASVGAAADVTTRVSTETCQEKK